MTQEGSSRPEHYPILSRLTDALITSFEEWYLASKQFSGSEDLETIQLRAVLEVLSELGLDLETLSKINTQDVVPFPVQHVVHYKGGHYLVLGDGLNTETEESVTIYRKAKSSSWYARLTAIFTGFVDKVDKPRFTPHKVPSLLKPLKSNVIPEVSNV